MEVPVEVTKIVEVEVPGPPGEAGPVTLEVLDPCGAFEVTELFAPRLDTLEGKTICELSNDSWEAPRTFGLLRELLQEMYPTAKFVTYDNFPMGTGALTSEDTGMSELVKAAGCDAVITGNAG